MTVPFDERMNIWRTDADGQAKPFFNMANNVHQIRSKETLCDYLHWAADYPIKKTWLAAIKNAFFAIWLELAYELVSKYLAADTEETAAGHLH